MQTAFSERRVAEPKVSVVMACRDEVPHIEPCLRSMLSQQEPAGGLEVIVADGMSTDGTREVLARLCAEDQRVRVVDNPGCIVSTGLNAAIRAARGSIIVRMDAHSEYAADYICQCVDTLERTKADNVGGPALTKAASYVQRAIAAAYHCPLVVGGARFHDEEFEGDVDTVVYGCWRKEIFDRIGLFDEELVRNQDDEFNLRLSRNGGKIWQTPRIRSWYYPRSSLAALFRQYMQYGYWKVRVIQKHRVAASVRHLVPGAFILTEILLLVLTPFSAPAAWGMAMLGVLYVGLNVVASVSSAARAGWELLFVLPLVVGAYQLGYGWGFVRGIHDFVILRRTGSPAFAAVTRQ